jgi:hypothetical protein
MFSIDQRNAHLGKVKLRELEVLRDRKVQAIAQASMVAASH